MAATDLTSSLTPITSAPSKYTWPRPSATVPRARLFSKFAQNYLLSVSFYTDTEKFGAPFGFRLSADFNQTFPSEVSRLCLSQYSREQMTQHTEDYYPIVLAVESVLPSSHKVQRQVQYTYGSFTVDESGHYKFNFLKRKLLVSF